MNKSLHLLRKAHRLMLMTVTAVLLSAVPATALAEAEAYARLTDNTLTFYYDENKGQSTTDFDLNTDANDPAWYSKSAQIANVVFDESFKNYLPTTCYKWFCGMRLISSITGLEYLNTSEVTIMGSMFYDCTNLTQLDLSHFNTAKVIDMSDMFYDCAELTSLDISSFNTENVTNMSFMFADCSLLPQIDVSKFNTTKVTHMTGMFAACESLTQLNVRNFDTGNVVDMMDMFADCTSLTTLDLTRFDTSNVTSMAGMFSGCRSLTSVDVSRFNTENVQDMEEMFSGCSSLTELDIYDFDTSNVETMEGMFFGFSLLESLDMTNFNTANVETMEAMFSYCAALTTLDLSHFNTAKVKSMREMFDGCAALTTLDISNFDTSNVTDMYNMFSDCKALTTLDLSSFSTALVTNMSQMFYECSALTNITVTKNFTTAALKNSTQMFMGCIQLKGAVSYDANNTDATYANYDTGYLTQFVGPYVRYADETLTFYYGTDKLAGDYSLDTGYTDGRKYPAWIDPEKVESEEGSPVSPTRVVFDQSFSNARPQSTYMWFYGMTKLESIEGMEYLNTTETKGMMGMFAACLKLKSIDLSHFNTDKVTNMSALFYYCKELKSIDLSQFNTSQVTDMSFMFAVCSNLTSLDVSGFNTEKVKNAQYMFYGSTGLTQLDLSSFNTSSLVTTSYMFNGCTSLNTIYVSDNFTPDNVTRSSFMFKGCTTLKGAVAYDDSNTDGTYGNYTTGYFTKKVGTNGTDILGATSSPLTIESLVIDDAKTYKLNEGEECQAAKAEYSRQMTSTWGTLCLPFALDAAAEGNTCNFYSLKNLGKEAVTLTPIESGTIEAGCPVIVCKKEASQTDISVTATNAAVVAEPVAAYADDTEDAVIEGTFESVMLQDKGYYFIAKDKFFSASDYSSQGVKVNPFRAYIQAGGTGNRAAALGIVVDGSTTGIDTTDTIDMLNNAATEYYDMSGRRTSGLQKGINIVKTGNKTRKVIVK